MQIYDVSGWYAIRCPKTDTLIILDVEDPSDPSDYVGKTLVDGFLLFEGLWDKSCVSSFDADYAFANEELREAWKRHWDANTVDDDDDDDDEKPVDEILRDFEFPGYVALWQTDDFPHVTWHWYMFVRENEWSENLGVDWPEDSEE